MAKLYTTSQKKAYYSGMGYRTAVEGKKIPFKSAKNYQSFCNGYKAAKNKIGKYPPKTCKNVKTNTHSPVYDYSKYYDFTERGSIKGHTTADGFFEPD